MVVGGDHTGEGLGEVAPASRSPESVLRAIELGLPMFLGILGGTAEHWAQYGTTYRAAWDEVGHPTETADIAVAVHGFVAADDRQTRLNRSVWL